METRTESITGLAEIVHQHKNKQIAFAFATTSALSKNAPAMFHSVVVWPTDTGSYGLSITRCDGSESMSYEVPANATRTSVAVYKWILKYFHFCELPVSVVVGDYCELIKLANTMVGNKPDREDVARLNDTLLSLILFIQRSRSYYVSRSEIMGTSPDWDREVKRDWDDIPTSVFERAGIKKNKHNYEEMLHFEITQEMLSSPAECLCRFTTPFWNRED